MAEQFVHDDRFVESFANKDHVVLGQRLDPFCLWHQFNLEIAQSKILLGEPLTLFDLWVAVKVCTTPWSPGHRVPALEPPGKIGFLLKYGRFDLAKEIKKFEAYLTDYSPGPKFWPNQHKTVEQGGAPQRDIDENLELALYALKESGLSWRDIWTMPIGMLRWVTTGLAKLGGAKLDIWTPEHEEMFQEHKRKREASIDARGKEIAEAEGIPFEAARKKAHEEYWKKVNANIANARESQPKHGSRSG